MSRHIRLTPPPRRQSRQRLDRFVQRAPARRVRSAKRSLAERARGLAAISASPGSIGWPRGTSKVGSACSGLARQPARGRTPAPRAAREELLDDAVLERVEGHDREPAAGLQHALGRGEAAQQLAELVVDGDAQGLETRASPDGSLAARAGATRATSPASCNVETNGVAARSATMARAMRRAARSSPK